MCSLSVVHHLVNIKFAGPSFQKILENIWSQVFTNIGDRLNENVGSTVHMHC